MMIATERFSSRVENYIRYRPGYPQEVLACLRSDCRLTEDSIIADVGSGTGILSEMLLRNGNVVYGVEPNRAMREAGERLLQKYPRFQSTLGTAEETTLADAAVNFVTAGQAFHWFNRDKAKREFQRILKSQGWVVLIWNERHDNSTPFDKDYEELLKTYATDYEAVNHKQIDEKVLSEFFSNGFVLRTFASSQHFDFDGLKGRLLSSSYAPEAGHPQYQPILTRLKDIFESHQKHGQVAFEYDTNMYFGHLE